MAIPIIPRERIDPGDPLEVARFEKFVCPPKENPDTPDRLNPDVTFFRKLMVGVDLNLPVPLPDGTDRVRMQVIADNAPDNALPEQFPAPAIRVRQGQIVHTVSDGGQDGHTIHHHGIEPTPVNDGVGKDSFEIGSYTYQWQPNHSGTYFYHCHKNTTLHAELGMYGFLIVDPPQGEGFVTGFNPPDHIIPYDVEALWAVDEIDPRWHELGHDAFMAHCGADPNDPGTFTNDGILHDFRPTVFVISGIPVVVGATPVADPRVEIRAAAGQTILLRVLNAGYTIQEFTLGLDAEVIAMDGRPLGVPPYDRYSFLFKIPAGTPFRLTSARRWDLIIRPAAAGTFPAQVDFYDWVNGAKLATAGTVINVTGGVGFSISGAVTSGGVPLAGVTMTLGGAASAAAATDAAGNYSFAGLADGDYTITPSLAGFAFTPQSSPVAVSGDNVPNVNFVGTPVAGAFAISGTVKSRAGIPIAGVTMALNGTVTNTVLTDASGNYSLAGLPDGNYTVTPSRAGLVFTPSIRTVTINGANVTGQDFIGSRLR